MVRTVKIARVEYLTKGNGREVKVAVVVANNDEEVQRAINKIEGKRNSAFPLDIEYNTKKYELDDTIFFRYAKEVND